MIAVNLETNTATLAEAMNGSIELFNTGTYIGTEISLRKLTGMEIVRVIGSTSGARIEGESWIVDRFGTLGARQIRRLLDLVYYP